MTRPHIQAVVCSCFHHGNMVDLQAGVIEIYNDMFASGTDTALTVNHPNSWDQFPSHESCKRDFLLDAGSKLAKLKFLVWNFWFQKTRCSWDICLWNVMMSGMLSKVRAWIFLIDPDISAFGKWNQSDTCFIRNLKDKHGKNCHQLSTLTNIRDVCFLPNH